MAALQVTDIQGFILSSYASNMPCATYMMLRITDYKQGRTWLSKLYADITPASDRKADYALNIAFTSSGLAKFGFSAEEVTTFPQSFQDGMTATHRSSILGDQGINAPENWKWGNKQSPVDILVLLFAANEDILAEQVQASKDSIEGTGGIEIVVVLAAGRQPDSKEHFGFLDGIGQPVIEGSNRESKQFDRTGHATVVKSGEFILGYLNELNILMPVPAAKGMVNFGINGTYLVFRQIEQNVSAFWKFLEEATRKADGTTDLDSMERTASKMVGRWKSGAPLTKYPLLDPVEAAEVNEENDFEYQAGDRDGFGCPFGSHIRRANPRDSLNTDPVKALQSSKRHRIIRRGRSYGDRTKDVFVDDGKERGLHFICLNSSIERQFEFIQQTWINNKTFAKLYDEVDPIIGQHTRESLFTIQQEPVRCRIQHISNFTTLKGGAYFFMPGMAALRFLAGI